MLAFVLLIRFFKTLRETAEWIFWVSLGILGLLFIFVIKIGIWFHTYLWPVLIWTLWVFTYALGAIALFALFLLIQLWINRRRFRQQRPLLLPKLSDQAAAVGSWVLNLRVWSILGAMALWWWRRRYIVQFVVFIWFLVLTWPVIWIAGIVLFWIAVVSVIIYWPLRWTGHLPVVVEKYIIPTTAHIPLAIRTQLKWPRMMRYWYVSQPDQDLIFRLPGTHRTHSPRGRSFPTDKGVGVYFKYVSGITEGTFTTAPKGPPGVISIAPKDGIARDVGCTNAWVRTNGRYGILYLNR